MTNFGFRTKIGGQVHYDSRTTDLGRYITALETGGSDGSWSNAELLTGQVDYEVVAVGSGVFEMPEIFVSGSTISWAYPPSAGQPAARVNCYIAVWVV